MSMGHDIIGIGIANHRNDRRRFGIKREDRLNHLYVIGKTGTGKSTLLGKMALQDFAAGNGFALIDPHGDLVHRLNEEMTRQGGGNVIYLDATDPAQPYPQLYPRRSEKWRT